jgi:hypothetical protein
VGEAIYEDESDDDFGDDRRNDDTGDGREDNGEKGQREVKGKKKTHRGGPSFVKRLNKMVASNLAPRQPTATARRPDMEAAARQMQETPTTPGPLLGDGALGGDGGNEGDGDDGGGGGVVEGEQPPAAGEPTTQTAETGTNNTRPS